MSLTLHSMWFISTSTNHHHQNCDHNVLRHWGFYDLWSCLMLLYEQTDWWYRSAAYSHNTQLFKLDNTQNSLIWADRNFSGIFALPSHVQDGGQPCSDQILDDLSLDTRKHFKFFLFNTPWPQPQVTQTAPKQLQEHDQNTEMTVFVQQINLITN